MIEQALQQLIQHPRKQLIVITLSFVIGLVLVLPLVDEYSALCEQTEQLTSELEEASLERENLPKFEQRITQEQAELAKIESRAISDELAGEFRQKIVMLVRESGCQVRRVNLGDARQREWLEEDDPIRSRKAVGKKIKQTEFDLKSRVFSLAVSGTPENVQKLLAAIHSEQPLAHTHSLSVRPTDSNRFEVVLELELWLFELTRRTPVSA